MRAPEGPQNSVLFVAFERFVFALGRAGQLVDQREPDHVAGFLGQVFLDLNHRAGARAHVLLEPLAGDVVAEVFVLPLGYSEICRDVGLCHLRLA